MITLDAHMHISNVAAPLAERLIAQFARFPNPEWEASKRFTWNGQPGKGIKQFIELATYNEKTGALTLPRGLFGQVRQTVAPAAVVKNRMVIPTAFNGMCASWVFTADPTYVPRNYQADAVQAVINCGGGVVVAGTGTGKTVIGLELARRLQTPTLFLVHTLSLAQQTADRAREMLGIEAGVIGGGKWHPKWFTVATIETLAKRGVGDLADKFGLVILDEAHHCPAETFAAVMQEFTAAYRVGLTATPERADGLTPILHAVIGPEIYRLDGVSLPLRYEKINTGLQLETLPTRWRPCKGIRAQSLTLMGDADKPKLDYTQLLTILCGDPERTKLIADTVAEKHTGMSLVITERVGHAQRLTDLLREKGLSAVMLAGPKAGPAIRRDVAEGIESGRYTVLVSTPGMVGEGFDCPKLDTLFLAAPHGQPTKTQQLAGRVTRPYFGKTHGLVVDFVDQIGPLLGQARKRASVYRRLAGEAR